MLGVAALAPEVNAAKNLARLQPGADAARDALAILKHVNGYVLLKSTLLESLKHARPQQHLQIVSSECVWHKFGERSIRHFAAGQWVRLQCFQLAEHS